MAGGKKGGSGDMVLESRHLVGLFLLLAVIFGIVFTLGYLLGRSQYDTQLRAATAHAQDSADNPADHTATTEKPQTPPSPSDWTFYHSADPKPANDHLVPAPGATPAPLKPPKPEVPTPTAAPKPAPAGESNPGPRSAPAISKGQIVLQVAATVKESDALALAQVLQAKRFPAFVLSPGTDKYYRVQVGPYADAQSAGAARDQLEKQGFKSIVKR